MKTKVKVKEKQPHQKAYKSKWNPRFILMCHKLAREGANDTELAAACGVHKHVFRKWVAKKPEFAEAIETGRVKPAEDPDANTFQEYVYKRLPPNLKDLWDQLVEIDSKTAVGQARIEKLFESEGLRARQMLFVHALISSNFNASAASRLVGISHNAYKRWVDNDPRFAELMDEVQFHKKNFFENALIKLVKRGSESAIIMVNKSINRDRGYGDKMSVEVSGGLDHRVVMKVDDLNLSLAARREVLEAVRAKRIEANGAQQEISGKAGAGKTAEEEPIDAEWEPKSSKKLDN